MYINEAVRSRTKDKPFITRESWNAGVQNPVGRNFGGVGMKKYKAFGCSLGACLSVLLIGGDLIPLEIVSLLTLGCIVSFFGMWYQYDSYIQQKAQHELNERLKGARR